MLGFIATFKCLLLGSCLVVSQGANNVASLSAPVDLELVLAVDISGSMGGAKLHMQREGYERAFRDDGFMQAVKSGPTGRVAVVYLEWAGAGYQNVLVPWTLIERQEDATRFASALAAQTVTRPPPELAGTSVSGGLIAALRLFNDASAAAARRVVDISGDGANNSGPPIVPVREALVARGITINGLPIEMEEEGHPFNYWGPAPEPLKAYFDNCVIGGPDSFSFVVSKSVQFDAVLRRKLLREIVASYAHVVPVSAHVTQGGFDCSALGERPGR